MQDTSKTSIEQGAPVTSSAYNDFLKANFTDFFHFIWTYRFIFLVVLTISAGIGIVTAFLIPAKYTASATILPPQTNDPNTAAILSNFGGFPGNIFQNNFESIVKIYPDIARSRYVLRQVLDSSYNESSFRDILQKRYNFSKNQNEKLINKLRKKIVRSSSHIKTNIVTISATYYDSEISAKLVNEILTQMENYFKYHFKSVSMSQRRMIEQRLYEISDSLKVAEENLLHFQESNITTTMSPKLQFIERRLSRELEVNNALYVELNRQFELAKIQEIQLKPVLNILDYATPPIKKSWPPRTKICLLFIITGFFSCSAYLKVTT